MCQTTKPAASTTSAPVVQTPIWQSDAYSLYRDKVVQGPHEGRALSATRLTSNYVSPVNDRNCLPAGNRVGSPIAATKAGPPMSDRPGKLRPRPVGSTCA